MTILALPSLHAPDFRRARRALATALKTWRRSYQTRQGLADIDPRMLADLGISRAQADFELSRAQIANRINAPLLSNR